MSPIRMNSVSANPGTPPRTFTGFAPNKQSNADRRGAVGHHCNSVAHRAHQKVTREPVVFLGLPLGTYGVFDDCGMWNPGKLQFGARVVVQHDLN